MTTIVNKNKLSLTGSYLEYNLLKYKRDSFINLFKTWVLNL